MFPPIFVVEGFTLSVASPPFTLPVSPELKATLYFKFSPVLMSHFCALAGVETSPKASAKAKYGDQCVVRVLADDKVGVFIDVAGDLALLFVYTLKPVELRR